MKDEELLVKKMTEILGRRKKGRSNTTWKDACKRYMNTVGLNTVEAITRATWRNKSPAIPTTPHGRETPREKN